jgi:hypothetical protein
MGATLNNEIQNAFQKVTMASYAINQSGQPYEELINEALDKIITAKKVLQDKTLVIQQLNQTLDLLTWIETPMEGQAMAQIHGIIVLCRQISKKLQDDIEFIKKSPKFEYCDVAIEAFENEVDEFEEAVEDVNEIFFDIPNDLEFIALAKKI